MLSLACAAKINLVLDVLGKRQDGYHELVMVMQSVSLYDILYFEKQSSGIAIETEQGITGKPEDNLIYKAAVLLQKDYTQISGIKITLKKKIPLASGLAGGSADCAGALQGLNLFFKLGLTPGQLEKYASQLGSDIAFCLYGGTYLAEGRGEILTKLPDLPIMYGIILKPPFSLSTAAVYQKIPRNYQGLKTNLSVYLKKGSSSLALSNQLYPFACQIQPREASYLQLLKKTQPVYCQMSGSGPAIFSFYSDKHKRDEALISLNQQEVYPIETVCQGIRVNS